MKPLLGLTITALTITQALASQSFGHLSCTVASTTNYSCNLIGMPLYNQRLVSDMHCAPTSGAMGLATVLSQNPNPLFLSWTSRSFKDYSEKQRIKNFGSLMWTTETFGTSANALTDYARREGDFLALSSNIDLPVATRFSASYFKTRLNSRYVDMVSYGHYTKKCTTVLGERVCTFNRDGGHFIMLNGYSVKDKFISLEFNDPWNGVKEFYSPLHVFADQYTYRPYSGLTYALSKSDNYYAIIDGVSGIKE